MCGILGLFGDISNAREALSCIGHRGKDATVLEPVQGGVFGHVLHALVGDVPQPVTRKGTLLFNGEIYNWKDLAEQYGIVAENDTELLLGLLDRYGPARIPELVDGVYAYAYLRDGEVTLQRDLLGVKPLWYAQEPFGFASEAKALKVAGLVPRELHPRTTITYTISSGDVTADVRPFVFSDASTPLKDVVRDAVQKRIPPTGRVGMLFSGGVDSSLLALLARDMGADVTLYVAALDDPEKQVPHDLLAAREAAESLQLPLVEVRATLEDTEKLIPVVANAIESSNPVKVGVALPLWLCAQRAQADEQRVLFSGLGAEEVFAGYHRHKQALDINKECLRGLRAMHERDLYRDDVVGMSHTLEIRLPFLDHAVIAAGLAIPGEEKIVDGLAKVPLRRLAKDFGLPERIAMRPKRAAQYGSQFDAAIEKLARRKGMKKGAHLRDLVGATTKLCALLSSGKDSVYALYTMQRMDYDISCCATIIPENPHSYMYHAPLVSFAEAQAKAIGVPWLSVRTPGEKEEELDALRSVLRQAIEEYGVEGVVSGALYSDYQRSRIERVAEELGLRVYAPLWHIDQEQEVREILDAGFSFVLSRVAADGLDKSWVGREITHDDIDALKQKLHLNVAGEGGEYESLVIDGPNFSEPLDLSGAKVVCEKDGGSGDVCELRFV